MSRIRRHISYANVMSSIAVFLVLGGASAFAAHQLAKHSVGAKQLKRNAVTTAKIKKNAVTGAKVKNHSLAAADFKPGQLPAGPQGSRGAQGPRGDQGDPGPFPATLPSGKSLSGTFGATNIVGSGGGGGGAGGSISFQFPLESSVAVHFLGPGETDAECKGSAADPSAPAGVLCVYEAYRENVSLQGLCSSVENTCPVTEPPASAPASVIDDRHGVTLELEGAAPGPFYVSGTWAVTAP